MDFLKAEQLTGSKWRVLAIPFGGPFEGKDFDEEYFDHETDVKPHWFKARPVIFHHGQDDGAKDEDYGEQELDEKYTDEGWWSTVWLNRSARYWAQVDALLRAGKMFGSSGAISHLVRKDHKSGHILVWPHAEQTLTLTPANPYARITASKAVTAFDAAGIALDPSILSDLDSQPADLRPDLSTSGEPPAPETGSDLGVGGDDAAIQRLTSDPRRQKALRQLAGLAPRLGELTKNP